MPLRIVGSVTYSAYFTYGVAVFALPCDILSLMKECDPFIDNSFYDQSPAHKKREAHLLARL